MNWEVFKGLLMFVVIGPPLAAYWGQQQLPEDVPASLRSWVSSVAKQPASASSGESCERMVDYRPPESLPGDVLHFWRPNCVVSIKTEARVRALRQQGYKIRSINTLEDRSTAAAFKIDATPTFIYREDGRIKNRVALGLDVPDIIEFCRGP